MLVATPEATEPAGGTMEPKATVTLTLTPTATPVAGETDTLQIESVMVTGNRKLMIFLIIEGRHGTENLCVRV